MQTEQLEPIGVLRLFDTSKEDRSEFVIQIVEKMESGEVDPLKIHAQVKCMEDIIDRLTNTDEKKAKNPAEAKAYKTYLLDQAKTYGKEKFQAFNGEWKVGEFGTKYDYAKCGDNEWLALDAKFKEISEAKKEREKFLQSITKRTVIVNDETGETSEIYPPAKTSTTGVSLSLK